MAILLAYAFTGSVLTPTTTAAGITGGTLTNQSLTSFIADTGVGYATQPFGLSYPASGATTAGTAISTGSYFTFSITPTSGNSISLTTLTFNVARGGAATPRGYDVRHLRCNTWYSRCSNC